MLPLVEKLLRDATCRGNFRKALFSETQKCPLNRQICPFGRFIKSMPLVANANIVAISLIRFVRVGVLAVVFWFLEEVVSYCSSSFFYWSSFIIETVSFDYCSSNFFLSKLFKIFGEWGGLPIRAKPHEPCICIYVYERTK